MCKSSEEKMSESMKVKTFGFGLRAFKRYPEIIPLSSFVGIAVVGCVGYMGYALYTKPDLQLSKSKPLRFENVAPEQSTKLIQISQQYKAIPELEALRKEIGSYKS